MWLVDSIHTALLGQAHPEKVPFLMKYFKAVPGGYGEGDTFLGVTVPDQRAVAKQFWKQARVDDIQQLLTSPIHEHRLTALFLLIHQYEAVKKDKTLGDEEKLRAQKRFVDMYLTHLQYVNNRDLVDTSAPKLLWDRLLTQEDRSILKTLAGSLVLREQRIAVLATFAFIPHDDFHSSLELAEQFLTHSHDLMHKAVGWMLREIGKRDRSVLLDFLGKHSSYMPRVMLSYAMEHLRDDEKMVFRAKKTK